MEKCLTIGPLSARPGEKVQGMVPVYDTGASFPVTLVNGAREGKTVLITSGVHSCEYCGIQAAIELAGELDPARISGRVILCHPLNRTGFEAKTPNLVPEDGKNLNRVYPGDRNGTLTDQIAFLQTEVFQSQADFYLDLHCGEVHDQLTPYVYYVGATDPEVCEASQRAALAVDVPYMVKSMATTGAYNSAGVRGVPSILLERGCGGDWDPETVALYKQDVRNVLRHLGVLPGDPAPCHPQDLVDLVYLDTEVAGCWYPAVDAGGRFAKGQKLGEIRDYFGNTLKTYYARYDGVVLYRTSSLWIEEGGGIVCYGRPAEGDFRG